MAIQIVWFKRDLRVYDHAPLIEACRRGQVLALFCWEPLTLSAADTSPRQLAFAAECVDELEAALQRLGLALVRRSDGILASLEAIRGLVRIDGLWSHQETGNATSYAIDRRVAAWCRIHGIGWTEIPQNGVVRRLDHRDRWLAHWEKRMSGSPLTPPTRVRPANIALQPQRNPSAIATPDAASRQRGGRSEATTLLKIFLGDTARRYRQGMSSPLSAADACSRLSAHLAWGSLSLREIVAASRARKIELRAVPAGLRPPGVLSGITAFEGRLHWHCHFMQKLESEPALEFCNLHRGHDGLRNEGTLSDAEQARLAAWSAGQTGWPLVDACMAMLRETGWINFRMRAMLASVAAYPLWLHWRAPGLHLARSFTDYEPGIHWPQMQMQSGTTGINALRMYNPVKQAHDQDPQGIFVRRWLPAMRRVPDHWLFEPWKMPPATQRECGVVIGRNFPSPPVELGPALRAARQRFMTLREDSEVRNEAQAVLRKHGSRKGMPGGSRDAAGRERCARSRRPANSAQLELF